MIFDIKSEQGYRIVFADRRFDPKNWLINYTVSLFSPGMEGTVRVYNPPFAHSPLALFKSMETQWSGWRGEKSWGSLEGEFDLSAESDSTGHIVLRARIFAGHSPPSSRLDTEIIVEAGQLAFIAKQAEKFFVQ